MYLTLENIRNLDGIVLGINTIEDEKEKEQFLEEHIEDTALFLKILKKLNKKKIPQKNKKTQGSRMETVGTNLYCEEEIYSILCEKSNAEIISEYSLSDLKKMYASIYKRNPTSSYTKERIVGVLRNRMHTMKRAEAFALVPEE